MRDRNNGNQHCLEWASKLTCSQSPSACMSPVCACTKPLKHKICKSSCLFALAPAMYQRGIWYGLWNERYYLHSLCHSLHFSSFLPSFNTSVVPALSCTRRHQRMTLTHNCYANTHSFRAQV